MQRNFYIEFSRIKNSEFAKVKISKNEIFVVPLYHLDASSLPYPFLFLETTPKIPFFFFHFRKIPNFTILKFLFILKKDFLFFQILFL